MSQVNIETVIEFLKSLQENICSALEAADGSGKFVEDNWIRAEGGGGRVGCWAPGVGPAPKVRRPNRGDEHLLR